MKAQMKAVMASAVVIVLALAAVSGVTYSWWSDSEETQISVSSGYLEQETTGMKLNVGSEKYDLVSETGFKIIYGTSNGTTSYDSNSTILTICGDPDNIQDVSITYKVTFKSSVDYAYAVLVEGDGLGYEISSTDIQNQPMNYNGGWVSKSPIGNPLDITYNVMIKITSIEPDMSDAPVIIKNVITQAANSGASTVSGDSAQVVDALTTGGDLLVVEDITVTKTGSEADPYMTMNEDANLSLGGNTLTIGPAVATTGATYKSGTYGLVINGADVTISGGTIRITDQTLEQGIRIKNGGSLTFNNVTIESNVGLSTITLSESQEKSSLIMKGCSIVEGYGSYVLTTNGIDGNKYNVSIEDCEFGSENQNGSAGTAVYFAGYGDYRIIDSTIKGGETGVEIRAGTLVMEKCSVYSDGELDNVENGNGTTTDGACLAIATHTTNKYISSTIRNCTFNGPIAVWQTNPHNMTAERTTNIYDCIVEDVTIAPYVNCNGTMSVDGDSIGKTSLVSTNDGLKAALTEDYTGDILVYLLDNLTYDVAPWDNKAMGGEKTESITIVGNEHTLTFNQTDSDWNNIATKRAKLVIENAKLTNSGYNDGPWNRHDLNFACDVELVNITSDKAMAFKAGATLNNVTISDTNTSDTYAIWIQPNGQTVTIDGCTIDMLGCTDGRGIKIDEQYVDAPQKVTLKVSGTTFKTEEKSAILVKNSAGADITVSSIDISAVAADSTNAVWVDADASGTYDIVSVIGGSKIQET